MPSNPEATTALLQSLMTSDRTRAAAFDAVHNVTDDGTAQKLLAQLPFSDDIKAQLWDARKGVAPPERAIDTQARPEDFTGKPTPQGSATSRFMSGVGQYVNPVTIAGGLYQAGRHPINTASAAAGQMRDQWQQAGELAQQGRYVEAAGHAGAGSLPLVGPAAAQAGEQIASGDVAGGLGATAGLLGPALVAPVARGATQAAVTATRAIPGVTETVAGALERGAANRVSDVMSPKVGANKVRFGNQAQKVAPEIAKDLATDGAPMSRTGLAAHVEGKLGEAEAALDAAADARGASASLDTKPIIGALKAKRGALVAESVEASKTTAKAGVSRAGDGTVEFTKTGEPIGKDVAPAPNAARIAALDQVIAEVKQLGPVARYEAIRRIRQAWDQVAKVKYAPSVTADFLKKAGEASGAADATAALRDALAQSDPSTAAANAKYSLYRTANDVLKAAEETERTRPKVGRAIMARLAGALIGESAAGAKGAIAGYVGGPILDSALNAGATTKLQTAALMQKLATAVRTGDVSAVDSVIGKLRAVQTQARRGALVQKTTSPSESQTAPAPATP